MVIQVEVTPEGLLKVVSPQPEPGEVITLNTIETIDNTGKGKWSDIKAILDQIDTSDIPKRTHEEIMRDLGRRSNIE